MISKLPRWVWVGGWVLAFIAGIINVIGLMGFAHETITHLTGNTTRLSEAVANLDLPAIRHIALLMGAFVLGTVISGFIIQDSTLKLTRRYSVALMLESALLCASVPLLKGAHSLGMFASACAIGIQNAMASTYSGTVVRSTHVSGMFTDLGISLGHVLRGLPVDRKRVLLCIVVISGFFVGGITGTLLFHQYSYSALYFPASLTALSAITYAGYRTHRLQVHRRMQITPSL
jgi:uncharacterized membrane protein YoaK (UPF0700 family)